MLKNVWSTAKMVFTRQSGDTPVARGLDRYRRAGLTAVASVIARAMSIVVALVTVPVTIQYLGPERFGLWMTMTGFLSFLALSDLGLGMGLQNALSQCHGREDRKSPSQYVSSALLAMTVAFGALVLMAAFVFPLVPWESLVKVKTDLARRELLPTAQAMLIVFGFGLPTTLIQRIYNGYQRGYWAAILMAIGRVLGLGAVFVCLYLKLGLPDLAASVMAMPFLTLAAGGIVLFYRDPWLRPSWSGITWQATRRVFRTGIEVMLAQISSVLPIGLIPLIIANRWDVVAVTPYSVTNRLLSVALILLTAAIQPLWPAYGEAAARGDWGWVRRAFRRSLQFGAITVLPVALLMTVAGPQIIRYWTGEEASVPDWSLLMACNVWWILRASMCAHAFALAGLNRMRNCAVYGNVCSLLGLSAAYWLAETPTQAVWLMVLVGELTRAAALRIELMWVLRHAPADRIDSPLGDHGETSDQAGGTDGSPASQPSCRSDQAE